MPVKSSPLSAIGFGDGWAFGAEVKSPLVPARAPRRKAAKKPTPPTRRTSRLQVNTRTILIDRLEAALAAGVIDLLDDDKPAGEISITTAEYALLLRILLEEEFPADARPPATPTRTAPGSDARIDVYAERVRNGVALYHPTDDCPLRADLDPRLVAAGKLALSAVERRNGSGPKVVGWHGEIAG